MRSDIISMNGAIVSASDAQMSLRSAANFSVSAVYEGIRGFVDPSDNSVSIFRLGDHCRRLIISCNLAGLRIPFSAEEIKHLTLAYLREVQIRSGVYVRISVYTDSTNADFVDVEDPASITIEAWPSADWVGGIHSALDVCISTWARPQSLGSTHRIKSYANYALSRLAALEARRRGFSTPLQVNDRGCITEGVAANLFIVRGSKLITPTISSGALEGFTRDTLITLAPRLGLEPVEREVDRHELAYCDASLLCGTAWGVVPLNSVDGLRIGSEGRDAILTRIMCAYDSATLPDSGCPTEWYTPL